MTLRKLKLFLKQFPFFIPAKIILSCKEWIDSRAKNYSTARGPWYELIEQSEHQVHPLPNTVQVPQKQAFDTNISYRTNEGYVFMLRNVFLYRHKGLILSNFNCCFQEFSHHFNISSLRKFLLKHPFYTYSSRYKQISGTGAVLISPESHNYYHWLSDVLPRIKLYSKVFDHVDYFCVASSVPEKFLAVLPAFGIPIDKILVVKDDEKLHFDNLLVASLPGSEGRAPAWAVNYTREKLLGAKKSTNPTKKIYFKRGTAGERKILNEDSIISLLLSKGFEIIEPDGLSILEQAALMQGAKTVAGFHGAALSNLLFAPGKCNVIELFSPDYFRTDCYYTLAGLLKLNYWYILGTKPAGAKWGDIIVPEDVLADTLNKIETTN